MTNKGGIMILEVKPVDDCCDCVFCEELNYCKLKDGEHCNFDYLNERYVATSCPLINKTESVTDRVRIIER